METNSSGEELFVKTRKPYTITKQREKWTEEEHNKFIEALKLYGRAWQKIEEYIGTKTAVQIRSHAQKFFTKLEKEALMKGIPSGQARDIEIPPPRPKRKPSSPYPRKTGVGSLYSGVESMDDKTSKSHCPPSVCKQATEMENDAPRKTQGTEDNSEDGSRSEVLNLFKAAPSGSVSSLNKGPSNTGAFKGFVPLVKGIREDIAKDSMFRHVSKDLKGSDVSNRSDDTEEVKEIQTGSHTKYAQNGTDADASEKPGIVGLPTLCQRGDQSFSKHVPTEFSKGNCEKNMEMALTGQMGIHTNAKPSFDPITPSTSDFHTNSGISSIHHSFPSFPPFTPLPSDHDAYRSFLNISSTFSSLIVSTLLQNPAVHAAACLAASFWPSAGTDASVDSTSQTPVGGIPDRHMNPSPSVAAIAAATVAAASAWWATQGLLPVFHPLHPGFAFAPAPTTTINTVETVEVPRERKEEEGDTLKNYTRVNQPVVEPEQSDAIKAQNPSFKSLLSSSDTQCRLNDPEVLKTDKSKPTANDGFHDSDKGTGKKKLDRSSCGSNTPSSSEVETDVLEKQNEDNDKAKQDHFNNLPCEEANTKRIRCTGSINESWKEVSEEGRIAFRALFARGVLPQSFSPPHPKDSTVNTDQDKEAISELPVDLNMKACENETTNLCRVQEYGGDTIGNGLLTSENGHMKIKVRRTGFKPYKRCSMEAKESRSPTGEESGNKRIRLEGETSI